MAAADVQSSSGGMDKYYSSKIGDLSSVCILIFDVLNFIIIMLVCLTHMNVFSLQIHNKQTISERSSDLQRLKARRNELNAKVRMLREELYHLQEPGSYVGEVIKQMGQKRY